MTVLFSWMNYLVVVVKKIVDIKALGCQYAHEHRTEDKQDHCQHKADDGTYQAGGGQAAFPLFDGHYGADDAADAQRDAQLGVAAAHHDSSNSQNQSHNSQSIGFLGPIRGNRLLIRVVLEILTVHLWSSS